MMVHVQSDYDPETQTVEITIAGTKVGKFATLLSILQYSKKLADGKAGATEIVPGTLKRVSDEINRQARSLRKQGVIS